MHILNYFKKIFFYDISLVNENAKFICLDITIFNSSY